MSNYNASDHGIVHCSDWSSPFCIEYILVQRRKATELCISVMLFTMSLTQMIVHICREAEDRCSIKSKYIIMTAMVLSLLSNCLHCLFHQIVEFFYFQTFFFNVYYVTIVYYVFMKLLEKISEYSRTSLTVLRVTYALLIILYVAVLITSMVMPDKKCQQIWYLLVRVLGLLLACTLIVVGIFNQNTQRKKLLRYPQLRKYKNPLPTLWAWIALNTIAQFGNVVESLVFTFDQSLGCRFSPNPTSNFIATFIMLCVTYYLAIIPTLWIFWYPICRVERVQREQREESYEIGSKDIEIMSPAPAPLEETPSSNIMDD